MTESLQPLSMAPDSAAADEVVEPYVGGSSSSVDAEEYIEVKEEEAPSHLPFAPSYEVILSHHFH